MHTVEPEDDVDVTARKAVFIRRGTLAGMIAVVPCPVVIGGIAVPVDAPDVRISDIILLVIRKMRAVDHDHPQVRARVGHALRRQLIILIVDLIPLISVDHG